MDDGVLEVLLGNQKVALLDPHTGAFTNLRTQQTDKAPAAVIHGANLDHEDHWVYYSGAK